MDGWMDGSTLYLVYLSPIHCFDIVG